MNRISACLAMFLTLSMLAAPGAQARTNDKPIVIMNNKGGNVVQTMQHREKLVASGRPVEIRGYCRSACTMYITMPNACLAPDATIGFHAPRLPGTQVIPPIGDHAWLRMPRWVLYSSSSPCWRPSCAPRASMSACPAA